ncbi:ATP-dependent DNA helicase PIF1 [Grifola frondosa]|uniref:ATP-dependent DNA helicase n=1 Tax=Grifola frondosa TaxID=5627 RepID=A0A1C7MT96_GRIFR|nr:ATP-dependent DNA helicase PIF1 [Grifola frondosa]
MATTAVLSGSLYLRNGCLGSSGRGPWLYDVSIPVDVDDNQNDIFGHLSLFTRCGDAPPAEGLYYLAATIALHDEQCASYPVVEESAAAYSRLCKWSGEPYHRQHRLRYKAFPTRYLSIRHYRDVDFMKTVVPSPTMPISVMGELGDFDDGHLCLTIFEYSSGALPTWSGSTMRAAGCSSKKITATTTRASGSKPDEDDVEEELSQMKRKHLQSKKDSLAVKKRAVVSEAADVCNDDDDGFTKEVDTSIGVSGGFTEFPVSSHGPPAISITGRTYHLLRDAALPNHSIHWFLYDERARENCAHQFNISSTIIQAITDDLRMVNLAEQITLIVGTSALATMLYERACTAHFMFGIPVSDNNIGLHSLIPLHSARAQLIDSTALIIWDELPMVNKAVFEAVHHLCAEIKHSSRPFGGIPFIGLSDFRQVAPVISGSGPSATVDVSIKSSYLWNTFKITSLTLPIRSAQDPDYTAFVDFIGEDYNHNHTSLNLLSSVSTLHEAVDFLFPPHILSEPDLCLQRAFLTPKNIFVDEFNDIMLDRLPGDTITYYSSDSLKENEDQPIHTLDATPNYLATLEYHGVPPHFLHLKVGAICTIQRNLSVEKGLVCNSHVVVHALHQQFVEVCVLHNVGHLSTAETFCIPRITFTFTPPHSSWTVYRHQFPLCLAYATTFHGCQGLTLDCTILDLRTSVFAHGQLYTALSRVRNRLSCHILFPSENTNNTTENVVY